MNSESTWVPHVPSLGWKARAPVTGQADHRGSMASKAVLPVEGEAVPHLLVYVAGRDGGLSAMVQVTCPWTLPATSLLRPGGREGQAVELARWPVHHPHPSWCYHQQAHPRPFPASPEPSWLSPPPPKRLAQAHNSSSEGREWPVSLLVRERSGLRLASCLSC